MANSALACYPRMHQGVGGAAAKAQPFDCKGKVFPAELQPSQSKYCVVK